MHSSQLLVTLLQASTALGYASFSNPSSHSKHASIHARRATYSPHKTSLLISERKKRQDAGDEGDNEGVLIGDLVNGITTPIGQNIADLLLNNGNTKEENFEAGTPPSYKDVSGCVASSDPCCKWYFISQELTASFLASDGQCTAIARQSIRMGFHDAGTWSSKLAAAGQDYGGADGSLVLFNEMTRSENFGMESAAALASQLYKKYSVSMADLIQYMSNHATVTCPLGPRVRTYIGRKDATRAAPDGLLPSVHAPADDLIALFQDKTISPHDLVALLGAHSTSTQSNVDTTKAKFPQDSTPGVWDVKFYNETLPSNNNPCVFKLESDVKLSQHPSMATEWLKFVDDQEHWNEDYARSYVRLSLLGVNNINSLKECTLTLPAVVNTVPANSDVTGKCPNAAASPSSPLASSSAAPTAAATTTPAAPVATKPAPVTKPSKPSKWWNKPNKWNKPAAKPWSWSKPGKNFNRPWSKWNKRAVSSSHLVNKAL